jgi:hypothetical protein
MPWRELPQTWHLLREVTMNCLVVVIEGPAGGGMPVADGQVDRPRGCHEFLSWNWFGVAHGTSDREIDCITIDLVGS